jgi:hypothetical protein
MTPTFILSAAALTSFNVIFRACSVAEVVLMVVVRNTKQTNEKFACNKLQISKLVKPALNFNGP